MPRVSRQAICGYGSQDVLPFRSIKEGELFFVEDREVNLVELALATNIPKGCAETTVRGKARRPRVRYYLSESSKRCPSAVWVFIFFVFLLPLVNVSYLDGKGNLEPQGTGKSCHQTMTLFNSTVREM